MYWIKIDKIHHENIEDAENKLNNDIENKILPNHVGWIDGFGFFNFHTKIIGV